MFGRRNRIPKNLSGKPIHRVCRVQNLVLGLVCLTPDLISAGLCRGIDFDLFAHMSPEKWAMFEGQVRLCLVALASTAGVA